jgi:hypothetical protein
MTNRLGPLSSYRNSTITSPSIDQLMPGSCTADRMGAASTRRTGRPQNEVA